MNIHIHASFQLLTCTKLQQRTYIKRRPALSVPGNVGDSVAPSCLVLITTCIDQVAQMKNWKSNGISTLLLTVLFRISMLIRTFFIIDWLFAKLKKNKIENLCFYSLLS